MLIQEMLLQNKSNDGQFQIHAIQRQYGMAIQDGFHAMSYTITARRRSISMTA